MRTQTNASNRSAISPDFGAINPAMGAQTNASNGLALSPDFGVINPAMRTLAVKVTGSGASATLRDLERELKEGPEGGWFMGKHPGRCDILVKFQLSVIKQRGWVDLEKEYPELDKWLKRVYEREAWKRRLEKGNGYDLTVFSKGA
jgi:glutathione S-transferase